MTGTRILAALRVGLEGLAGRLGQASGHQRDRGPGDQGLTVLREPSVAAGRAASVHDSAQAPFHRGDGDAQQVLRPVHELAGVGGVRADRSAFGTSAGTPSGPFTGVEAAQSTHTSIK